MVQTSQENAFKLSAAYIAFCISFQLNTTFRAEEFIIRNKAFRSIVTTTQQKFFTGKKYPQRKCEMVFWLKVKKLRINKFSHSKFERLVLKYR